MNPEPDSQILVLMVGNHWTGRTATMAQIAEYRLYPVDTGGHVDGPPKVFSCGNDEAAINLARYLVDGHDVELWQLDRLVTRLPSTHH